MTLEIAFRTALSDERLDAVRTERSVMTQQGLL